MAKILITPDRLQLAEPLMAKYFDYDSTMLFDEKLYSVQINKIDCTCPNENSEYLTVNYERAFYGHKELKLAVTTPYKEKIHKYFSKYFQLQEDGEEENITGDDIVMLCLEYMSYIYHKTSKGLFNNSQYIELLDLEDDIALHNKIYPEMLSLYRMILDSKNKRNRNSPITISCKQEKIEVNSHAWFLDDMEKYFSERFPDMTIEKIDEILGRFKGKAGRKFHDRNVMNIIWGTYRLLRDYHSKFKQPKPKISNEICKFIIDYLDYMNIKPDGNVKSEIRDMLDGIGENEIRYILKDTMKRNYTPKWNLIWRNVYYDIEEKQPENIFDRPIRRYDIY